MYQEHRFLNIPQSCKSFIDSIMEEKDTVKEFLANAVEEGDPKDFVKVKDLYNDYNEAYRTLQRDKKTFKTSGTFQTGVARVMKDGALKSRHQFRNAQGRSTSVNSVLLGYKRKRLDFE